MVIKFTGFPPPYVITWLFCGYPTSYHTQHIWTCTFIYITYQVYYFMILCYFCSVDCCATWCLVLHYVDPAESGDVLRQVVLPIISRDVCRELYNIYRQLLTDNMLCAGYMEGGKDSCTGDSGGPLVCKQGGRWWQHGIVSWGAGCARPNFPGINSDVVKYLPWITKNTESQYCM